MVNSSPLESGDEISETGYCEQPARGRHGLSRKAFAGDFMIDIKILGRAMREISAKKGEFTLFALFRREGAAGWDLVVSSSCLQDGKLKALGEFAKDLKGIIGEEQLEQLSRIVTINEDDPALRIILKSIHVDDGQANVQKGEFFGQRVEDAIFLRAKRLTQREARTSPHSVPPR